MNVSELRSRFQASQLPDPVERPRPPEIRNEGVSLTYASVRGDAPASQVPSILAPKVEDHLLRVGQAPRSGQRLVD